MAKNKERIVNRSFDYNENNAEYRFQIKKKFPWWILLLLLLLLLLLIGLLYCLKNKNQDGEPDGEKPVIENPEISNDPLILYPEDECGGATASGGEEGIVKPVKMGRTTGSFLFEYITYEAADRITIYNGKEPKGNPIFRFEGSTDAPVMQTVSFNSNDGYISVVVEGLEEGTAWEFIVHCPDDGNSQPLPPPLPGEYHGHPDPEPDQDKGAPASN